MAKSGCQRANVIMHKDTEAKEPEFYIKKLPNNWTMFDRTGMKLREYKPRNKPDYMKIYLQKVVEEWKKRHS